MSDGTCYFSVTPNITLYTGLTIRFKNGRYPKHDGEFCTPEEIAEIEAHPMYGRGIESNKDREAQNVVTQENEERLVELALEKLSEIPGVVPSDIAALEPVPTELDPVPVEQPDPPAPELTLTDVNRMNREKLIKYCHDKYIDVTPDDTVAIMKRKVRAFIRQPIT